MTAAFRVPPAPPRARVALSSARQRVVVISSRARMLAASRRDPDALIVDVATGSLARLGRSTHTRPQVLAFVIALAAHPGAVVANDDMVDRLWGDDPEGGPLDTGPTLSSLTRDARAALLPLGLAVETTPGRGRWLRCGLAPVTPSPEIAHGQS